nr:hypothetical protein [Dechloromonas sp.]
MLFPLALVAELLCFDSLVAERWPRSIPITLAGVLFHGAQGVLAVFLALVLIEDREDLAGHLAGRIIAGLLRD